MVQQRRSLDGLSYYRPGAAPSRPLSSTPLPPEARPIIDGDTKARPLVSNATERPLVTAATPGVQSDIATSLQEIDALQPAPAQSGIKPKRAKKPLSRRRVIKWAVIGLAILILAVGGWLAWRFFSAAGNVFKGNALGILLAPAKPLKADQYGNTNVLLLGTSESDPNHPGAQLTDSMMIISVNQNTHQSFLLSIPRDLWVTFDNECSAGDSGKINAVYECNLGGNLGGLSKTQNDEQTAETMTAAKISTVTGIDVQYVAHLNLAVIQKVVDAVGGIDITIESPDPRGILDRNFDWRCNYKCYLVKYPNGPAHLDGTHAMWLAQARNDAGGYGLPRSNFDRENNQRKILTATKDKATSIGFLANPVNVVNLLDALGSNIHTTIDSSEVKTFINVAKDTPTQNIASIDIMNDAPGILTTGTGPDGSSIVRPVAGIENYKALQAFTKRLLQGGAPLISENATVDVYNGGGAAGAAKQVSDDLESNGISISMVTSVPANNYPHYTIYDLSGGKKPKTLDVLKSKLGGATISTQLPKGMYTNASFVVVVGPTSSTSTSQQ